MVMSTSIENAVSLASRASRLTCPVRPGFGEHWEVGHRETGDTGHSRARTVATQARLGPGPWTRAGGPRVLDGASKDHGHCYPGAAGFLPVTSSPPGQV